MNLEKIIAIRNAKTIYCDENNCVKVFNKEYSKADILNEALNQARVEELPINVPKIKEVTMIDGKWAIITEYIKGYTLLQLMEKYPEKKDQYLEQFVDIQLATQKNTCPLLTKLKDKMNRKINMADIASTTKYDLHTRLESMPKHNKVCHGDFNPSNVIVGKNGKMTVVDWAHATQGNASADAAMTYLLFALKDQKVADLYLKLFCKKSDTAMQYVQQWLPIVAAAQLSKENELEKDFLMRWIDVVDYQ